jgi:hypothetical protein
MKKYVLASACALALVGLAQQRASAWCNFNFSAGINLGFQSGGWERNGGGMVNAGGCQPGCWGDGGCGALAPQYYPLVSAGPQSATASAAPVPTAPHAVAAPALTEGNTPKRPRGTEPAPAGTQPAAYYYRDASGYYQPYASWNGR